MRESSSLVELDPVLQGGVLGVRGRLNTVLIKNKVKHLVILSKDLYISSLVVRSVQIIAITFSLSYSKDFGL